MSPKKIFVKENISLVILWDDGSEGKIKLANLRKNCPCALCRSEKEEHGEKYIPLYSAEQIAVKEIKMIGSYAINIIWKDDHDTGIYDFNYLKNLSA